MPNHCSNILSVSMTTNDSAADLLRFVEQAHSTQEENGKPYEMYIDFNKFIPYPEKWAKMDEEHRKAEKRLQELQFTRNPDPNGRPYWLPNPVPPKDSILAREIKQLQEKERQKDGYNSGGYDWCREKWGTKWNAYNQDVAPTIKPHSRQYTFTTAWSPPEPVIKKMSELYPTLRFTCEWSEEGGYFGKFQYIAGKLIKKMSDERR